ncbi:MAG: glycosyltransferase family 4 protein [Rhodothermales bacterium]
MVATPGQSNESANSNDLRVTIFQRVFPHYRLAFFDALSDRLGGQLTLVHGRPLSDEGLREADGTCSFRTVVVDQQCVNLRHQYLCRHPGLARVVLGTSPDVVVAEPNMRLLSTPGLLRAAARRGIGTLGWGLGRLNPPGGLVGGLRDRRSAALCRQFDALVAYSTKGAADYERIGIPRSRIFVARNAVASVASDVNWPAVRARRVARDLDRIRILSLGRLLEGKRVDDLLRACSRSRSRPELVVVGDGPDEARLRAIADSIYPDTVFAGHTAGPELDAILADVDVFVLPGLGGLAIQQAVTAGLPVIVATGDGTQGDLVGDGRNGYLIDEGDVDALVARIDELAASRELRERMGRESLEIARNEVNLERMVESMVEAIRAARRLGAGRDGGAD